MSTSHWNIHGTINHDWLELLNSSSFLINYNLPIAWLLMLVSINLIGSLRDWTQLSKGVFCCCIGYKWACPIWAHCHLHIEVLNPWAGKHCWGRGNWWLQCMWPIKGSLLVAPSLQQFKELQKKQKPMLWLFYKAIWMKLSMIVRDTQSPTCPKDNKCRK